MKLVVLISCMQQKDASIIERTGVQTDVVVVNQCDRDCVKEFDFVNNKGRTCHAKFICTTERGLSHSRNMAIQNAWGDYCIFADDDETLSDGYEQVILSAFERQPKADIIAFNYKDQNCRIKNNYKQPISEE